MLTLVNDRYEVLALRGQGGEAQIVKALDRRHDRVVALKIRPVPDAASRAELLTEARILLALAPHPALPLVREDFFDGDRYVVAMDWVDGTDLATLLAERGRPGLAPSSVLGYLAQAAEALTHLHTHTPPVIHGDVKPSNLILTRRGRIKLVDFGLSSAPNLPLRRAGTPGYRAPELAAGAGPSRAADVYALAATAFALLTGGAPAGVLPSWEGIDPAQAEQLEAAVRLGMATVPARRPQSAGELVERLRAGWAAALPTGVVTLCLSDVDGHWGEDPAAMARHDELIAGAMARHGGSLVASMGDATVSVFDSAPAAVAAALEANRELSLPVRWGLHTGEADRRDDYSGPTASAAARVRSYADGGQVFVSAVTAELVSRHLPDGCTLVDVGPDGARAVRGPGASAPLAECPYRGLPAFEDRRFFFGREAVVADVIRRLEPGRLLAVVGASGSGKSSLLRAGVVAAVRAGEVDAFTHATLLVPGADPVLDVTDGCDRLLVVDQFEELFTLCADADRRRAFIDGLLALDCAVVIGVRADVYARLSGHAGLARAVAANQVLLGPMSATELARAITEPARLAGLRLEPGLVELVLRDVTDEPGALPLLSHALRATWDRRDGRTLTVAGYRASGGVATAIARTADAVVDALPEEQRRLARGVFLRMTELGEGLEDTRRRVAIDELVPEHADPASADALLRRLADARLVTLDARTAQVAHEALIREWPRLRQWLDEDRAGMRAHRQLGQAARLWDAGGREPSDLYRGARLDAASEPAGELNATERAFLDASASEAGRERRSQIRANRRLRALLFAATLLLGVAIAGGVLALGQRDKARRSQAAAEGQALSSDAERMGALALGEPTLERSLLLAAAGVTLQDRPETRGALLSILQQNPAAIRTLRLSDAPVYSFAVSPDDHVLASGDVHGVVRFIDLRTYKPAGDAVKLPEPVSVQAIRFAPNGRTLAVGTRSENHSGLYLIDVARRRWHRIGSWSGGVGPDQFINLSFAFSPDGRRLAAGLANWNWPDTYGPIAQRFMLFDGRTGRRLWRRQYPFRYGQMEARVLFSRDGALITSAPRGATLVWDARSGRIVRRFPIGGRPGISADGHTLALALNSWHAIDPSAAIALLDLRTGRVRHFKGNLPTEWIYSLGFSRDGKQIVGPSWGGVHIWDIASGEVVDTYGAQGGAAGGNTDTVIDRRGLAFFTSGEGSLTVWDPEGTRRVGRSSPNDASRCSSDVCWVTDAHSPVMAAGRLDGTTGLRDPRSGRVVAVLPARDGTPPAQPVFLPGGRRLATGGDAGTVTIWDVPTRTVVQRLRYSKPVLRLAVSPHGTLLAVAQPSQVEVRALDTDRTLYTRPIRFGAGGLAFTRDGRELVMSDCCDAGAAVIALDARSGALRFSRGVTEDTPSFALSPRQPMIAVGTSDGRVLWWDVRTGRTLRTPTKVTAAQAGELAFSPDGRLLAVVAAPLALWDVATRKRVGSGYPEEKAWVPGIAFNPDGRLLIFGLTATSEWPTDLPTLQRSACQIAGRDLTPDEWREVLPNRPYRHVCPR
ncbi:nSTAND1 domain-containing NTPase [Solirubrobacter soli]|uniref:nSTAND1 domain-containing NTPase n=1 Tax=Solirubrobacter soli TaxID=363832 RepID=UPI0003F7318C|nr:protein kinase [Solirubrobacter soli]